jgi:hypothetical protein
LSNFVRAAKSSYELHLRELSKFEMSCSWKQLGWAALGSCAENLKFFKIYDIIKG